MDEVTLQRAYYAQTAKRYDSMHDYENKGLALPFLFSVIEMIAAKSVLDVGAGTGAVVKALQGRAEAIGIEPVQELREQGHRNGLSPEMLIDGDGYSMQFPDGAFDVVCEFAVLHHVRHPNKVVTEMLRVARKAVFIFDANNFGQGRPVVRAMKQGLHTVGLWPVVNYIKTRGKGYCYTEGDGVSYSYSVFDSYPLLEARCSSVHVLNTDRGVNPYRSAAHCALIGIK